MIVRADREATTERRTRGGAVRHIAIWPMGPIDVPRLPVWSSSGRLAEMKVIL